MATLVFDIETIGNSWDDLDTTTQASLTSWIDKIAYTKEERSLLLHNLKEGLGFSPLTGQVIAIGLYDV